MVDGRIICKVPSSIGHRNICSAKTDGTKMKVLAEDAVTIDAIVHNGRVYYDTWSNTWTEKLRICSMNLDGGNKKTTDYTNGYFSGYVNRFLILDKDIYYPTTAAFRKTGYSGEIVLTNLNNNSIWKTSENSMNSINVAGGRIYYLKTLTANGEVMSPQLYSMNLKGGDIRPVE